MRKRHPLEVYLQGKPFQHQDPDAHHPAADDFDPDWTPSQPRIPRAVLIGAAALLFLVLALVGPWLYTGKFWPASAIGWSGSPDDADLSPWPDRISDRPGGGSDEPDGGQHFVILVASGMLSADEQGRTRDLERWQHEEQRLQQRLDESYPDQGLVARCQLIRGTDTVGLIVSRWYEEDDPGMKGVLDWLREPDGGDYTEATAHRVAAN